MTNDEREKIGAVKYDKIHSNAGLELPKTSTTEKTIVAIASEFGKKEIQEKDRKVRTRYLSNEWHSWKDRKWYEVSSWLNKSILFDLQKWFLNWRIINKTNLR